MDEPLSNLDALLRLQARADLKRLHDEVKRTTVYVTHDQIEAMSMGDRIAVMRDGEIVQCAAPMAIYDRPATRFVGGFIGSPPMNFIAGAIADGAFVGDGFRVPVRTAPVPSGAVVLGIRAEHLRIGTEGVPAQVMVVEPLGSHALVTAKVAGTPVKIEAPVDIRLRTDETIHLAFDEDRARWIASDTGAAIGPS